MSEYATMGACSTPTIPVSVNRNILTQELYFKTRIRPKHKTIIHTFVQCLQNVWYPLTRVFIVASTCLLE